MNESKKFNIFRLYDYGINMSLISSLIENNISIYDIYADKLDALNNINTSDNKKSKIYLESMKMIVKKDYARTINELMYQDISKSVCDNLIKLEVTIDDLRNMSIDKLKCKYNIGNVMSERIKQAIAKNDELINKVEIIEIKNAEAIKEVFNVFRLYDYGINISLIKELADNNISPMQISMNRVDSLSLIKTSENKKENIYQKTIEMISNNDYTRTIYELLYQGISKLVCDNLVNKDVTIDILRNLSIDELKDNYDIGNVMSEKIKIAINDNDFIISNSLKKVDTYKMLEKSLQIETINGPISFFDFKYKMKNEKNYIFSNFELDYAKLQKNNKVKTTMQGIEYVCISVSEYINNILDEKDYDIYINRLNGVTLQQLGEKYGVTRERIRQFEARINSKVNKWFIYQKNLFLEDKYKEIFEKYNWNEKIFCELFELNIISFKYLDTKYKKGVESIKNILNDEYFTDEQKKKYMSINKIAISETGEIIDGYNDFLRKFCLKYCKDEISIADITKIYNEEIKNYPELKLVTNTERSFEGKMARTNYIVAGFNHMVRYFDFEELSETAYIELEKLIDLNDGFYSTEYIYKNNIKLMKELDIRNEYELHNILKWKIDDDENNVYFIRMPNFLVEYKNKEDFILDKIKEYSPISFNEFVNILYEDYGHKKTTISAYLTSSFSEYIDNGEFNYNNSKFKSNDIEKLKKHFNKDIYSIEEVKMILSKEGYNDNNDINNYNFSKLGYKLKSGFILKKDYRGLFNYLDILKQEDKVIKFDENLIRCGGIYNALYYYCSNFDLFKMSDTAYITISKLETLGISKEYIEKFIKSIKDIFADKDYFSVYNVINELDLSKFIDLGLNEEFIANILFYIDDVKTLRINNSKLYTFKNSNVNINNFMYDMVSKYRIISLNELEEEIKKKYNIFISADKLRNYLYDTDIFYSNILDKIYFDKTDYYEEVYDE